MAFSIDLFVTKTGAELQTVTVVSKFSLTDLT